MSDSSSNSKPVLLGAVALLILVAIVFAITQMGGGDEETSGNQKGGKNSSKSSGRSASSGSGPMGERHGGKSDGKTEEERKIGEGVIAGAGGSGDPVADVKQLSLSARQELMALRAQFATEFDDPEERKAFGIKLSEIKDPNQRAVLLRERTKVMRAARLAADAKKTPEDRARERQLVSLMQIENMRRMADQILENPELQADGEEMRSSLDDFVQGYDQLEENDFHSQFNDLRRVLNDLRRRNQGFVNPNAPQPPGTTQN